MYCSALFYIIASFSCTQNTFTDKTPYTIMFGPDKCGNDNKVSSDLGSVCLSHGGQRMVDVLPCLVISAACLYLTGDSVWWTYYRV